MPSLTIFTIIKNVAQKSTAETDDTADNSGVFQLTRS